MSKQMVKKFSSLDSYERISIHELIKRIKELEAKGLSSLVVEDFSINYEYEEEETDAEYLERLKIEKKREAKEYAQYLKLKEKFEHAQQSME